MDLRAPTRGDSSKSSEKSDIGRSIKSSASCRRLLESSLGFLRGGSGVLGDEASEVEIDSK